MGVLDSLGLITKTEHRQVLEQNRLLIDEALMNIAIWRQDRGDAGLDGSVVVRLEIPKRHLIDISNVDPLIQETVMRRLLSILGRQFNAGLGQIIRAHTAGPEDQEQGTYR